MDFDINTWAAGIGIAVITAVSVLISVLTWKKSSKDQTYSNLDTLYQTMLQVGIENPELRVKKNAAGYPKSDYFNDENVKAKYDAYALMVWSFYESVSDDAIDLKEMGENCDMIYEKLQTNVNWVSYLPSFNEDANIHWKWYEVNKGIFKPQFQKLIDELQRRKILKIDVSPKSV